MNGKKTNIAAKTWAKKTKLELEKLGLAYFWQSQLENSIIKWGTFIKERCSVIERDKIYFR
jgi:hypothetical protein